MAALWGKPIEGWDSGGEEAGQGEDSGEIWDLLIWFSKEERAGIRLREAGRRRQLRWEGMLRRDVRGFISKNEAQYTGGKVL